MQIEKGIDKVVKTIRVMVLDKPGYFGKVATAIGGAGGSLGDIKLVAVGLEYNTRDVTIFVDNDTQLQEVLDEVAKVEGVIISDIIDPVLEMHRGGKISMKSRNSISSISTVRKIYTPGVAKVCQLIRQKPELARDYTGIYNSVAIVTNGTAILGLGDIGPVAGIRRAGGDQRRSDPHPVERRRGDHPHRGFDRPHVRGHQARGHQGSRVLRD
jgi:malate dehydrogenase (oxaloacetate-decarboxylating)